MEENKQNEVSLPSEDIYETLEKGSIDNPYTLEEYEQLSDSGLWTGGYVEGVGNVESDGHEKDGLGLYSIGYDYESLINKENGCLIGQILIASSLIGSHLNYFDVSFYLSPYYNAILNRYIVSNDQWGAILSHYFHTTSINGVGGNAIYSIAQSIGSRRPVAIRKIVSNSNHLPKYMIC